MILIGEMRDFETTEIALEAAETGHLVLSTLHTIDASKTVDRIIGLYPKNEEPVIRTRLAQTFRYIVSQRLIPRADGRGRIAAVEILRSSPRTREYIEAGEADGKSLLDAMRDGKLDGMQDFDTVIKELIEKGTSHSKMDLPSRPIQNNLLLQLKGVTAAEDYLQREGNGLSTRRGFGDRFNAEHDRVINTLILIIAMIIVCHKCASRLQVDDAKVPSRPVVIRCPKCNSSVDSGLSTAARAQRHQRRRLSGDGPSSFRRTDSGAAF